MKDQMNQKLTTSCSMNSVHDQNHEVSLLPFDFKEFGFVAVYVCLMSEGLLLESFRSQVFLS